MSLPADGSISSGDRRVSNSELRVRAAKAASGLAALGVGEGDSVVLYLRNDIALFEASLAAGLLGAYAVPANWHHIEAEALYLIGDTAPKAIIVHANFVQGLGRALDTGVPVLVVATPPEIASAYRIPAALTRVPDGMTDWDSWRDAQSPFDGPPRPAPAAIIYTSGTTGRSKGVRRAPPTPEQVEATVRLRNLVYGFGVGGGDPAAIVTVMTGPMYHSTPHVFGLHAARLGATIILQPRFDAEDLLRLIEERRVTHLHMVPIMFERLLRLPNEVRSRYDLSSLRFVTHGAAPVAAASKRAMLEWWGPIIHEYYGGTETSVVVHCTPEDWLAHPGTVGRPVPGAEVRILDEDGAVRPVGAVGHVASRLHSLPDFTYHGDDAKRRSVDRGGLIDLGDIGRLDEDGFLYLLDRSSEIVISGGVNIYPAEIEAELIRMPGVADCAIFGIPHAEFGEQLCAIIQPQPDAVLDAAAVRAFLDDKVSAYKMPRIIEFRDEVPREDSGKIFKRRLRDEYRGAAPAMP